MRAHDTGGFVGLILGIAFTLLVMNVPTPAFLKTDEPTKGVLAPDPNPPSLPPDPILPRTIPPGAPVVAPPRVPVDPGVPSGPARTR